MPPQLLGRICEIEADYLAGKRAGRTQKVEVPEFLLAPNPLSPEGVETLVKFSVSELCGALGYSHEQFTHVSLAAHD